MPVTAIEIIIAIQAIQALAALVLAMVLRYFQRGFEHAFLRHWALSAAALAAYLGFSASALSMLHLGPEFAGARLAFSILSLAAAYPHVVWLMVGSWEAARQKRIAPRRVRAWVAIAAAAGVASALVAPFDPEAGGLRNLLRVELRYTLTGAAFLVAGVLLWRARQPRGFVGASIGAIGFVLYGLQMLHVTAINLVIRAGGSPPFYTAYVGLVEFLFQSVIALGIVIWLMELQRNRAHRAADALEHARRHDPGTGLPNRELLVEQIAGLARRPGIQRIAVISIGINRFAMLSRALGWHDTEDLMRKVADRLHAAIGQRCALGRISDRDFVVARPTLDDLENLRDWTERLLGSVVQPVEIGEREIFVTGCAGLSLYPDDAADAVQLIQFSQHALVQSARIGRDVTLYQHLDPGERDAVNATLRFQSELRRALDEGQFLLYFQPILEIDPWRVAGFEALLRWHHPERGLLKPAAFLDEAASIGLLEPLEMLALQQAVGQLAEWSRGGGDALQVAVNVSAQRFQDPELPETIVALCREAGVSPARLGIEITENTALRDLDRAAAQIEALAAHGIGVALDDFGTGFSSLGNLLKLPVACIKLDQVFVEDLETHPRQRELVAAMIALGHRLGVEVVAEGIESTGQLGFLAEHGCDRVQGYLIQPPAAARDCRFEIHSPL